MRHHLTPSIYGNTLIICINHYQQLSPHIPPPPQDEMIIKIRAPLKVLKDIADEQDYMMLLDEERCITQVIKIQDKSRDCWIIRDSIIWYCLKYSFLCMKRMLNDIDGIFLSRIA